MILALALFSNFLAMLDVQISVEWSLEYVASLMGNLSCSAALGIMYLYSLELAPTSHRGMILSLCNASSRVGSFTGTYAGFLYAIVNRRVMFSLFAGLTCIFMTCVLFMSNPTGRRVPEIPEDVEMLTGLKVFVKPYGDAEEETAATSSECIY